MWKTFRDNARRLWKWAGLQENHNALVIILMILVPISVVAAGFYFESQLNNIRSDVEELFNRQIVEAFTHEDIELFNFYTDKQGVRQLEVILEYEPVANSVSLWFGGNLQSPIGYTTSKNIVTLEIDKDFSLFEYTKAFGENVSEEVLVVSYTKILK